MGSRPAQDRARARNRERASRPAPHGRARRNGRRDGVSFVLASPQARLRTAVIALVFVLSLFGARLFQLQVADAAGNAQRALGERQRTQVIPASRGEITDVNGRPLATTVAAYRIAADPKVTAPHAPELAEALAGPLHTPAAQLLAKLRPPAGRPGLRYVVLARQVDPASRAAVDAAVTTVRNRVQAAERSAHRTLSEVGGITIDDDPRRVYPSAPVAGNVVGFMGSGLTDPVRAGLELSSDRLLRGRDGKRVYETGLGESIPSGAGSTTEAVDGTDIRLTLDADVQWRVATALDAGVKTTGAGYGMAVVVEVATGHVVALAASPSLDPGNPGALAPADRGDPPLERVYEPGSVEKVLTMSALVDAGLVNPATPVDVPNTVRRDGETIHDDESHDVWHLTAAGVLAKSSNIGTLLLADRMPKQRLESYLRAFGLGARTGVLPGASESRGLLAPSGTWPEVQRANIAFGQGVAVTAVQMAAAVGAVANGGTWVAPTLIAGTTGPDGVYRPAPAPATRRVISPAAAAAVTSMMQGVVRPGGTAPRAGIPGFAVAGKTGTAQYSGQEDGKKITYADGEHTISFAGWAPAGAPRYLTYVVLHDPKRNKSGAAGASPIWREITTYLLQRFPPPPSAPALPVPPAWRQTPSP